MTGSGLGVAGKYAYIIMIGTDREAMKMALPTHPRFWGGLF
jgi:hypothetical protein